MFWEIVSALFFFFCIIPIGLSIFSWIVGLLSEINEDTRKGCLKGCGWSCLGLIFIIGIIGVIIYGNNKNLSESYERKEANKYLLLNSLRKANPGKQGYVLLQDMKNETFYIIKNTDGTFTIYKDLFDCYSSKSDMYRRYGYNYSYTCELL